MTRPQKIDVEMMEEQPQREDLPVWANPAATAGMDAYAHMSGEQA
jgi:hypothetical protein